MAEIGIVIPVHNGERFLRDTVESVLAQVVTDWELILVDAGSTDGSSVLIESFAARDPRIRVLYRPNGGVATARNAGLHALGSTCEFVIFLDHDDTWYPESLATLRRLLVKDSKACAAQGTNRRIDAAGHPEPRSTRDALLQQRRGFVGARLISWPSERPTTFGALAFMNPIVTPGQVLIRRSALLTVGSFDPSVAPADDWDLWLRLAQVGYLAYTDTAVLRYRVHDANVSARLELMESAGQAVRRKHALSSGLGGTRLPPMVPDELWKHWLAGYSGRESIGTRGIRGCPRKRCATGSPA